MKRSAIVLAASLLLSATPSARADIAPEWPRFAPGSRSASLGGKDATGCPRLPARLLEALDEARAHGNVLIRSTCGGSHANNSAHYSGEAVDFRVEGNCTAVADRFSGWNGGYNRIESCLFHLDVREKRRW